MLNQDISFTLYMAFSCIVNKIDSSFQWTHLQTIEVIKKSEPKIFPVKQKKIALYFWNSTFVYDIDNVSTNFHNEVLKIVEAMKRIARQFKNWIKTGI